MLARKDFIVSLSIISGLKSIKRRQGFKRFFTVFTFNSFKPSNTLPFEKMLYFLVFEVNDSYICIRCLKNI